MFKENNQISWSKESQHHMVTKICEKLKNGSIVAVLYGEEESQIVLYADQNLEILTYELNSVYPLNAFGTLSKELINQIFKTKKIKDYMEVDIEIIFTNKK